MFAKVVVKHVRVHGENETRGVIAASILPSCGRFPADKLSTHWEIGFNLRLCIQTICPPDISKTTADQISGGAELLVTFNQTQTHR